MYLHMIIVLTQELQFSIDAIPISLSSCAVLCFLEEYWVSDSRRDQDKHQKIDTRYDRSTPGPRGGPNYLRGGGFPPRASHALPAPMDQAVLADHRCNAVDLGHPQAPTHRKTPTPRPQQHLTCSYNAIYRILRRVGFNPNLKYPLPTTHQEVPQVRTPICELLAGAAVDGKLHLTKPTEHDNCTPPQANSSAKLPHTKPLPHPLALHSCSPPICRHLAIAHYPECHVKIPHHPPPRDLHAPATDSPTTRDPPPPLPGNQHTPA